MYTADKESVNLLGSLEEQCQTAVFWEEEAVVGVFYTLSASRECLVIALDLIWGRLSISMGVRHWVLDVAMLMSIIHTHPLPT